MATVSKPGIRFLQRGWKALLCAAAFLTLAAVVPKANAQVSINIGGPPPVCPYGYYDYAPYSCAPVGFYGPGYFYNGIFLGVGPWRHWGYRHGWGSHRFVSSGGGRYRPRPYHGRPGNAHGRPGYSSGHRPAPRPGPRPGNAHSNARPGGSRPSGGGRPGGAPSGGERPSGGRPGGPR
ncbi:MAG TPA: hypothetical protein VE218_08525 [Acidobacteriaceae bacterium]|nr:hypothetical protein [Acidobacteriaceae bacterium]